MQSQGIIDYYFYHYAWKRAARSFHPARSDTPCTDTLWADTPPGRHPPRWLLHRTVRLLLECILLVICEWIYITAPNCVFSILNSKLEGRHRKAFRSLQSCLIDSS